MKRPYSSVTYAILTLVLLYSICADFWMQKNGVPFGYAYLGPLFFIGIIVLYVLAIEASTVVPEKPSGARAETAERQNPDSSCALLVYDEHAENSFSAAWINTLEAHYGPCAIVPPGELAGAAAGKSVIVIPSWETESVIKDKTSVEALTAIAAKGASIIIDYPSAGAAPLLGLGPEQDGISSPPSWTYPDIIPSEVAETLSKCPVPIEFKPRDFHKGGYATWLRAGDYPAVAGKAAGAGGIIITLFDYARYATKLKQGAVETGFSSAITGAATYKLADPELHGNGAPFADILDSFICGLAGHFTPAAAWWPHPGGAKSSFILSCEDDGVGRRLEAVLDTFTKSGAAPTVFVAAGARNLKDSISAISQRSCSAGLLWNRFSSTFATPNSKSSSPGGLSSQAGQINAALPENEPVKISRSMRLRWDGEAEDNFGLMSAAGVETDCSFGPGPREKGYIFATGFPFHPVTASGRPAKVLEIPCQLDISGGADGFQRAEEFIENAASHNSPVSASFSARRLIQSERAREAVKDLLETAAASGLRLTSPGAFSGFWKARASSPLSASRKGADLLIVADAKTDDMFIRVPQTMRGAGKLSSISVNGVDRPASSLIRGNLLSVAKGRAEITLTYTNSGTSE